jgi:hypothetical protein
MSVRGKTYLIVQRDCWNADTSFIDAVPPTLKLVMAKSKAKDKRPIHEACRILLMDIALYSLTCFFYTVGWCSYMQFWWLMCMMYCSSRHWNRTTKVDFLHIQNSPDPRLSYTHTPTPRNRPITNTHHRSQGGESVAIHDIITTNFTRHDCPGLDGGVFTPTNSWHHHAHHHPQPPAASRATAARRS